MKSVNRLGKNLLVGDMAPAHPVSSPTHVLRGLMSNVIGADVSETLRAPVNYQIHITSLTIQKMYENEVEPKGQLASSVPLLQGEPEGRLELGDEEVMSSIEWHIRNLNGEIQALRTKLSASLKRMEAMEAKHHGTR